MSSDQTSRALIVEDNGETVARLRALLTIRGIESDSAADVAQAKKLLAGGDYRLIVLDLNLRENPEVLASPDDGIALLGHIRAEAIESTVIVRSAFLAQPGIEQKVVAANESAGALLLSRKGESYDEFVAILDSVGGTPEPASLSSVDHLRAAWSAAENGLLRLGTIAGAFVTLGGLVFGGYAIARSASSEPPITVLVQVEASPPGPVQLYSPNEELSNAFLEDATILSVDCVKVHSTGQSILRIALPNDLVDLGIDREQVMVIDLGQKDLESLGECDE